MKLGRPPLPPKPYTIADSYLYSSDVGESEHSSYSSTATYVVGDRCQRVSPTATVSISNATPCVVTWANHGLANDTPIAFTTSGTLPTGITASQVYFVKGATQGTFKLCTTPGTGAISTSSAGSGTHTAVATRHDIFEALIATASTTASISGTVMTVTAIATGSLDTGHILSGTGVTSGTYIVNQLTGTTGSTGTYTVSASQTVASTTITGNAPVTNSTYWGRADSTNKWRMFDASVSSQSSKADSMVVEVRPSGRYNALYFGNINFASVQVVIKDSTGTTQYDETHSGVDDNWDVSFYSWYFEPIQRKTDIYITDLPNLNTPRITATFTDTNGTVLVGVMLPVFERYAGATQYGMTAGIRDYSVKTVDSYGNSQLEERSYSRRCQLTLLADNTDIDSIMAMFAAYRSTAVLYVGSDDYVMSYIFGWFNDANIEISYPTKSLISCDLESLT